MTDGSDDFWTSDEFAVDAMRRLRGSLEDATDKELHHVVRVLVGIGHTLERGSGNIFSRLMFESIAGVVRIEIARRSDVLTRRARAEGIEVDLPSERLLRENTAESLPDTIAEFGWPDDGADDEGGPS